MREIRAKVFKVLAQICRIAGDGGALKNLEVKDDRVCAVSRPLCAVVPLRDPKIGMQEIFVDPRHIAGQLMVDPDFVIVDVPAAVDEGVYEPPFPDVDEICSRHSLEMFKAEGAIEFCVDPHLLKLVAELAIAMEEEKVSLSVSDFDKPIVVEGCEFDWKAVLMPCVRFDRL